MKTKISTGCPFWISPQIFDFAILAKIQLAVTKWVFIQIRQDFYTRSLSIARFGPLICRHTALPLGLNMPIQYWKKWTIIA